jgi:hypothetical protein
MSDTLFDQTEGQKNSGSSNRLASARIENPVLLNSHFIWCSGRAGIQSRLALTPLKRGLNRAGIFKQCSKTRFRKFRKFAACYQRRELAAIPLRNKSYHIQHHGAGGHSAAEFPKTIPVFRMRVFVRRIAQSQPIALRQSVSGVAKGGWISE